MHLPRLRLLVLLFLAVLLVPLQAAPSLKEYAVAINQSGRQRMLSQKMSKEFLLIVLNLDAEANKPLLKNTIGLFDSTLQRLLQGDAEVSMPAPPNDEIKAQLERVKAIWGPFRGALEKGLASKPSDEELRFIAAESRHLVGEMDKAVTLYENACTAAGFKGTGPVVNVAGRQRMLTQRMSKNILLLALKVEPEGTRADLQAARDLFEKSLRGLTDGDSAMNLPPTKNVSIRQSLSRVDSLWKTFSALVETVIAQPSAPDESQLRQTAELNTRLLAECQKVVSSYEAETF